MTSSTCHNLDCYNDDQEEESNKENILFKNKSESDLVIDKNKLKKIYLPAEDTMDMEQSFKESTGKKYSSSWFYGFVNFLRLAVKDNFYCSIINRYH